MTAMCKCERVWRQRRLGRKVLFVGDGASDYCAALQADYVMARDSLARYCEREGQVFTPFDDFFEVQETVAKLAEQRVYLFDLSLPIANVGSLKKPVSQFGNDRDRRRWEVGL